MENTTIIIFEFNGITYTADADRKYCYATVDGKKTRIGKAEFKQVQSDYWAMQEEAEAVEIVKAAGGNLGEMVAETEESNNTEAGKEIAKKMRKSKNTREVAGVALTEKQIDFIKHLPDTCFWEHGLDSCIWVDCLCDDIGGQFANKPMTVGAMVSTLCEKGLGSRGTDRRNGRKVTSFSLTEKGKFVAAELGLN